MKKIFLSLLTTAVAGANTYPTVQSIEEYNRLLPYWGATWQPDSGAINDYHPSFYTGFAPRSEYPSRIHIRQARGNQTRLSVILDENTVSDYLFDLVKRDEFYKKVIASRKITLLPDQKSAPQQRLFANIIASPAYGIADFVNQVKAAKISQPTAIYNKGLATLAALNPGRLFLIRLNLAQEFLKWKRQLLNSSQNSPAKYLENENNLLLAIDSLVPGRINYIEKPTAEVRRQIVATAQLALSANDDAFVASALELFKLLTASKYDLKTVVGDKWVSAIQCSSAANCTLSYPEFTAIYPTGSVMESTSDGKGNRINNFASPGLWNFYKNGQDPDRVGPDPYYGWAPKLYYDNVGNAYHNPGVKFAGISSAIKASLGAPANHSILWAVKRGAVSHGCSRLATGHVWEFRHILPVEAEKIHQTHVFINQPQDFDVYDVNGDGQAEVMGVEYLISYGLKDNNYDNREGSGLEGIDPAKKLAFYKSLYGANGVFTTDGAGKISFIDPTISLPTYLDFAKRRVGTRLTLSGQYPLYEQDYEKDKIQLYRPLPSPNVIRLMGRVRGCAPSSNKTNCGEEAFDREAKSTFGF